MDTLEIFRDEINMLDEQLIMILKKRYIICSQVAQYKIANNIPMMQPERIKAVVDRCVNLGKKNGLDEQFIKRLCVLIIEHACQIENLLFVN